MDIFELAKKAKSKVKEDESLEDVIHRLERKVERERIARVQAENTIEESSRRLYLSNQSLDKANADLEATILELNDAMMRLTSAEIKRKAMFVTLVLAIILFVVSEFAIDPKLESMFSNQWIVVFAKISIFALLIPIELITSSVIERNLSNSSGVNENMYTNLLISAYEDGIITDMERSILKSSAKQLGIHTSKALELEDEVMKELGK
jgi:hypothetical protein